MAEVKEVNPAGCYSAGAALVALAVGAVLVGQCHRQSGTSTPANPVSPATGSQSQLAGNSPRYTWEYHSSEDAMGGIEKTACITSNNEVSLSFPYHDTHAVLCLRRGGRFHGGAFLRLNDDGQILCSSYRGCSIPIRFDAGKVERFSGSEAADGSSNVVFINGESRLITHLKRAKRTVVALDFYRNGNQTLEFNTAGLVW